MEGLRNAFDHPYELVVQGGWDRALCHMVANGRRGVAETERKCCQGAPYVVFRREEPLSGRSCHVVVVGKGEATLVLPRLLGSEGDTELAPKPLVVEDDGGERLDGGVYSYQLSPHRNDKI